MATIEDIYQKKSQLEHVLFRPDSYIGSIEPVTELVYVLDYASGEGVATGEVQGIVQKEITFTPGFYKIVDEVLVNAIDHSVRLRTKGSDNLVTQIKVTFDPQTGEISVWNNGAGIDVEMHSEHEMYVPEMLFGEFLTSSNYDDEEKKVVGGRNGFGAKLTNAWSAEFTVETVDSVRKKKFTQTFRNNMSERTKPKVVACSNASYTKITFTPDYERFGMVYGLDPDVLGLLRKRVYDIAGCCEGQVAVFLDGVKIKQNDFQKYVDLYLGDDQTKAYHSPNERWEVCVALSNDEKMEHVSFVNGICTFKGGKHVEHVVNILSNGILKALREKKGGEKKYAGLTPTNIKDNILVFVRAVIENPRFDSQLKDCMTTPSKDFGSTFSITGDAGAKFIKKIVDKSGIIERAEILSQHKSKLNLAKTDGVRSRGGRVLRGIPKLEDATLAASADGGSECTLILTEGDSAKALALAALEILGRDRYGIFPLRGKPLNVRDAAANQVADNAEIGYLKQIIGLQQGVVYKDVGKLRYGRVLIMTDQDVDGSHIKGLVMNFFHTFWPSLLEIPGFLMTLATPIIRCTRTGFDDLRFYSQPEYEAWLKEVGDIEAAKWACKYFKGLGTNTSKHAKEIFGDIDKNHQNYISSSAGETADAMNLAFNKKLADARKELVGGYNREDVIDISQREISYKEFVGRELVHFSCEDNVRSIPSMIDGLKPSQRKILYACLKRRLVKEIKVAQLAGYVAEHSAYHHGEVSLAGTIIGMAADYMGSNNINLLKPIGQFGTRNALGKDSASPRYIFTQLEAITMALYHPDDMPLLDYLKDDGQSIEPRWYIPVVPAVLLNGVSGIGTGYSTDIPPVSLESLIGNIRRMLLSGPAGTELEEMKPWYRGFTGRIVKHGQAYYAYGRYERISSTEVLITELPPGVSSNKYKEFLEGLLDGGSGSGTPKRRGSTASTDTADGPAAAKKGRKKAVAEVEEPLITNFTTLCTDIKASFLLTFKRDRLDGLFGEDGDDEEFVKKFKLCEKQICSMTNMHAYDRDEKIKKYSNFEEILREFYEVRLEYYHRRKSYLEGRLKHEWDMNAAKVRFLEEVQSGEIVIYNRETADIVVDLLERGYPQFKSGKFKVGSAAADDAGGASDVGGEAAATTGEDADEDEAATGSFNYLLNMPLRSITKKQLEKLRIARDLKEAEYNELVNTTSEQIWMKDLDALEAEYARFMTEFEERRMTLESEGGADGPGKKKGAVKGKKPVKRV